MARLIDELKRLPVIGPKSAQRIAFHLLKAESAEVELLAAAIRELQQSVCLCEICNNAITKLEISAETSHSSKCH